MKTKRITVRNRYKILAGSQSAHCCFDWTVVDLTRKARCNNFHAVCETFNKNDAITICKALNNTLYANSPS